MVVIALLFFLAGRAHSEELQPAGSDVVPPGGQVDREGDQAQPQGLDAPEKRNTSAADTVDRAPTRDRLPAHQEQFKEIHQELASLRDKLLGDRSKDRERVGRQMEAIQASLDEVKTNLTPLLAAQKKLDDQAAALGASSTGKTDAQVSQARRAWEEFVGMQLKALRASVAQQRQDFDRAVVRFVVVGALVIGLLIIGGILLARRIRQVEQTAISLLSETATTAGGSPKPASEQTKKVGAVTRPSTAESPTFEPTRPGPQPLPSPTEQMRAIIASASRSRHIRVRPTFSSAPWELGLATSKGNVRSENQDYGLCFQTDGHGVLIVADGCGGVPHGQRAAHLASVSAAVSVVRAYGTAPRWHAPCVKDVAARAAIDAAHRLAIEGDKLNVTDVRGGLRATLIVVIGDKREVGYAYIGDGGGCVVKSSGEVFAFLEPQKASDLGMNVLAASLGPTVEGDPVTGVLKRAPGDLLIVGTDGVFDRVDETFPKDVLRGCIQYSGDLQKTAEHIVAELASFQDRDGYICHDNLSIGILGSGTSPKLPPGFWSPTEEAKGAAAGPVEATPTDAATCLKEEMS